ncbi:MAG TPA: hypothetical protein VH442_20530, partial [Micromonosporaceae bacterium]
MSRFTPAGAPPADRTETALARWFGTHPDRRLAIGFWIAVSVAAMITIGAVIVVALGHAKPVNALTVLAFILGAAFASWFMPQLRIGGSRHGKSLSDVAIILSLMVLPWPWAIL